MTLPNTLHNRPSTKDSMNIQAESNQTESDNRDNYYLKNLIKPLNLEGGQW